MFFVGAFSVTPQMFVPFAAHLAAPESRGRALGVVMSGLLLGILASRTASGFIGAATGWRAMFRIASGVTVALAADCNPGSAYSTSMPLAIALAVREMHMTPREAVHAATAGGAAALRRDDIGRIAVGQRADLIALEAPSYIHLAYRPGVPLIAQVWQSSVRAV
jgi:imidazolonepropionase-like amidohydrolase